MSEVSKRELACGTLKTFTESGFFLNIQNYLAIMSGIVVALQNAYSRWGGSSWSSTSVGSSMEEMAVLVSQTLCSVRTYGDKMDYSWTIRIIARQGKSRLLEKQESLSPNGVRVGEDEVAKHWIIIRVEVPLAFISVKPRNS
ncbi:hypothetical protein Tco_0067622 [Tanacetum coccineum]